MDSFQGKRTTFVGFEFGHPGMIEFSSMNTVSRIVEFGEPKIKDMLCCDNHRYDGEGSPTECGTPANKAPEDFRPGVCDAESWACQCKAPDRMPPVDADAFEPGPKSFCITACMHSYGQLPINL